MAENESLRMALEHYRQRKMDKLKEVQELDLMISRLSRDLGDASQDVQGDKEEDSSNTGISEAWQENEFGLSAILKNGAKASVRPDEFFGMTYSTAAEAYLDKVRHAVSMDELLDALNRGGCPVGGREPRKTLYISLIRDVRTFVPIAGQSGFLGLRKFYPNLKAVKEKAPNPKRKKRLRRKKRTANAKVEEIKPKGKFRPESKRETSEIPPKEKSQPAAQKEG
ncbi:MAG: hypothetical protein ACLP00_11970 [Terracidiphilus sp.]